MQNPSSLTFVTINLQHARLKADWSDFFGYFTVSNNFLYNSFIIKRYRLSPINVYRIGLRSKIEIFNVNKNLCMGTPQSKCIMGHIKKGRSPIYWVYSNCIVCIDCIQTNSQNLRLKSLSLIKLFDFWGPSTIWLKVNLMTKMVENSAEQIP